MSLLTPRSRLLLIAAIGTPDTAARAWESWRRGGTVDAAEWSEARVFPLVAHQLATAGVPDPDLDRLRGVQRHSWAKNMALAADTVQATALLAAMGVQSMVLKGVGLQHAYPQPGLRTMGDADLLVHPEHARRAMAAMHHAGWKFDGQYGAQHSAAIVRGGSAVGLAKSHRHIDLHWRPLHGLPLGVDDDLWARARQQPVPGGTVWVPDPSHQLVIVAAHGMRLYSGSIVQGLCDAAMLLRAGRCDPGAAADLGMAWQWLSPLREVADILRREFDDPVFEEFAAALRRRPAPAWRDRLAQAARERPYDRRARALQRIVAIGVPATSEPEVERPVLAIGTRVAMSNADIAPDMMRSGWSFLEPWGAWSDGRQARLSFRLADTATEPGAGTSFVLAAHGPTMKRRQRVRVRVNGRRAAVWRWPAGNPRQEQRVSLPSGVRDIEIELRIRHRLIPAASDPRLIGLGATSVWIEHAQ